MKEGRDKSEREREREGWTDVIYFFYGSMNFAIKDRVSFRLSSLTFFMSFAITAKRRTKMYALIKGK